MQIIIEQAQPYITAIVVALLGLLTTVVLAGIAQLRKRVDAWLESRTTEAQRATLHQIAREAFAHAETTWRDWAGSDKLNAALDYATQHLKAAGIDITEDEIKAAIHSAWLKYNAETKPAIERAGTSEMKPI